MDCEFKLEFYIHNSQIQNLYSFREKCLSLEIHLPYIPADLYTEKSNSTATVYTIQLEMGIQCYIQIF